MKSTRESFNLHSYTHTHAKSPLFYIYILYTYIFFFSFLLSQIIFTMTREEDVRARTHIRNAKCNPPHILQQLLVRAYKTVAQKMALLSCAHSLSPFPLILQHKLRGRKRRRLRARSGIVRSITGQKRWAC